MIAGQITACRDIGQDLAHDAAHRVLNKKVVTNKVRRHALVPARLRAPSRPAQFWDAQKESGGFCCQAPPGPA
ncbi:hypothetical protein LMG27198_07210 [Methylocystis echinoides]|uniref:Uncharacterized protein n=1 Tax=Methylocystis echinoides TaxID=29468 RepID=A0A9W6GRT0_9HYPH|nr:hypothetical protein LMG27198_07210 [Methylocystis echinoides]